MNAIKLSKIFAENGLNLIVKDDFKKKNVGHFFEVEFEDRHGWSRKEKNLVRRITGADNCLNSCGGFTYSLNFYLA